MQIGDEKKKGGRENKMRKEKGMQKEKKRKEKGNVKSKKVGMIRN